MQRREQVRTWWVLAWAATGLAWNVASLGAVAGSARASGDNSTLEEVTVTARRREENLQDVPVSVAAFSAKDFESHQIRDMQDAGMAAPNVVISPSANAGSSAASVFIRGIGQFDELVTTDPGVGIYVDGVYLARTSGGLMNIGDFERVEILRGPQGTLFGKNTIGGAINITSVKPGNELGGYVQASYGRFNRVDAKGAIDVPIVADTLSSRVSVASVTGDGFGQQANGIRTGNKDSQSARGQLRWTPTASVDAVLAADKTRVRERMEPRSDVYINPAAPIAGLYNLLVGPFDGRYLSQSPYFNYATGENTNNLDAWGTSLNVTWRIGETATLHSITAYRSQTSRSAIDADNTPAVIIQFNEDIHQNQFSQEVHVDGSSLGRALDWVVGAIYFHESASDVDNSFQVPDLRPFIGDFSRIDRQSIKNDSFGAFVESTYHFTERLSGIAGLRYTSEKKDWTYNLRTYFSDVPFMPPGSQSEKWSPVTPKAGVQFKFSPGVMGYATVSRGFRSGGFNGRANTAGVQSFNPEFVWTYEAGIKSQLLSNSLRVNAAVFYNDYRDLQLLVVNASATGGFDIFTRNAARAKTQGVELDVLANPVTDVELSASVGFLDAKVKEADPATGVVPGNVLQSSPRWSGTLGAQYTHPIASGTNLVVRADWTHRSKTYFDAANSETIAGSYSSLNARAAVRWDNGFEVAAFGTNLTNSQNVVGGFDAAPFGFAEKQWGHPREYGVSARKQF